MVVRIDEAGNQQLPSAVDDAGTGLALRCCLLDCPLLFHQFVGKAHRHDAVSLDNDIAHRRLVEIKRAVVDPRIVDQSLRRRVHCT